MEPQWPYINNLLSSGFDTHSLIAQRPWDKFCHPLSRCVPSLVCVNLLFRIHWSLPQQWPISNMNLEAISGSHDCLKASCLVWFTVNCLKASCLVWFTVNWWLSRFFFDSFTADILSISIEVYIVHNIIRLHKVIITKHLFIAVTISVNLYFWRLLVTNGKSNMVLHCVSRLLALTDLELTIGLHLRNWNRQVIDH